MGSSSDLDELTDQAVPGMDYGGGCGWFGTAIARPTPPSPPDANCPQARTAG
jgi:hypothetical protein